MSVLLCLECLQAESWSFKRDYGYLRGERFLFYLMITTSASILYNIAVKFEGSRVLMSVGGIVADATVG